jgi:hypothetical protein
MVCSPLESHGGGSGPPNESRPTEAIAVVVALRTCVPRVSGTLFSVRLGFVIPPFRPANIARGAVTSLTRAAIWELLAHCKGGEPDNLPGTEEFQECIERHPYADPDAVWTFLLFQPPPGMSEGATNGDQL